MYFNVRIKTSHMLQKPAIRHAFLLLTVLLFAFRHADGKPGHLLFNTSSILNPLKTDTGGRTVSLDSAQACIDRFAVEMKKHGFSDQAGQPVDIHITKTSMITTGEDFNGKNLQDWLNATAAQYTAAGKTLMIKIELGIYDAKYLNTYQPNAALRAANNNRIAIFLIPYAAGAGGGIQPQISAQPAGGTGGGGSGGTGYDLGGVQP